MCNNNLAFYSFTQSRAMLHKRNEIFPKLDLGEKKMLTIIRKTTEQKGRENGQRDYEYNLTWTSSQPRSNNANAFKMALKHLECV